jgi:hypothetical protein
MSVALLADMMTGAIPSTVPLGVFMMTFSLSEKGVLTPFRYFRIGRGMFDKNASVCGITDPDSFKMGG